MKNFATDRIRNIAVIGHTGEGKTSLCETMLFNMKATDRIGTVSDGTTVMDYDEQEIARNISISLAVSCGEWKDCKLNLIDVPGFYDFFGEQISAVETADSALIVSGASGTMSVGTEKAVKMCLEKKIPMMIFINAIDKENADYFGTVEAIRAKYPRRSAPMQIPLMESGKMRGYVNALSHEAFRFTDSGPMPCELPADMAEPLKNVYAHLMESAAESDDELLEKFFAEGALDKSDVIRGIKRGIMDGKLIPILAGSATGNKGVFNLMDEIVDVLPSPAEKNLIIGGKELKVSAHGKPVVHVFKTVVDPFVGRLNLIKVLTGTLKAGDTLKNLTSGEDERISSLYILKGKKQEPTSNLTAGDIGAVSKLNSTVTGDTLGVDDAFRLPPIDFPCPVFSMAVRAVKSGEEDKIFSGLNRLMDEDKTIHLEKNIETGETILSGLGETHIDVIINKLKNKFKVEAAVATPKIAYRETIRKTVDNVEGKHKKQSGGHGQYGHVKMRFEPIADGFEFDEEVVGGSVPKQYIPAVEKGLRENLAHGVLAGYPVIGLKAVLTDGSYHDVDSSEMAFKMAASIAFKEGLIKASPVIMEPICECAVTVPDSYTGDIMGDINKRRGRILGMDTNGDSQTVHAEVPESEMFKYATDLRSMTQGRGEFTVRFVRYEEVPPANVAKIIETAAKEREAK